MRILANSIWMNYEDKGKGEDLVLIHGAGDNINMWYYQVPAFSKNYHVITYDVRGAGKTDSGIGEYSIPLFAEDLYELMRGLKIKTASRIDDNAPASEMANAFKVHGAYYLGYSMGGSIALQLAIDHPEMVKAIILASSAAGLAAPPPAPEAAQRRQAMLDLLDKRDTKKAAEMMTTNEFSTDFKSKNPKEFDRYMKVKLQNKPDGWARTMRGMAPSTPPDLSKVTCPVLLIAGENDSYMSVERAKQVQQAIAGSKLVILPVGHAAAIELPDKFNSAVLEFLSGLGK